MSLKANSNEPVAKVADFGLTAAASSRLQQELLTWQWMAPEAFLGENYTESCDLYSFGMILWEIWTGTGEIPFESIANLEKNKKKQQRDLVNDVIHNNVRPECGEKFPPTVITLCHQLWEKNPTRRPSFAHCLSMLDQSEQGKAKKVGLLQLVHNTKRPDQQLDEAPRVNMSSENVCQRRKGDYLAGRCHWRYPCDGHET